MLMSRQPSKSCNGGPDQVERGFNRRKHRRGLATRYDKLGVVEMLDWLRAVPDGHDPRDRT
jgi:hypothetical protein